MIVLTPILWISGNGGQNVACFKVQSTPSWGLCSHLHGGAESCSPLHLTAGGSYSVNKWVTYTFFRNILITWQRSPRMSFLCWTQNWCAPRQWEHHLPCLTLSMCPQHPQVNILITQFLHHPHQSPGEAVCLGPGGKEDQARLKAGPQGRIGAGQRI